MVSARDYEKIGIECLSENKVHSRVNAEDGFDSDKVLESVLNVVVETEDSEDIFEELEFWLA